MADYGIKVSNGNTNIVSLTDVSKINFSSRYEMFKTAIERKTEVASGGTLNITHNFRYVPVFLLFGKSNVTANYKQLCTAARALTGWRTSTTTTTVAAQDHEATGTREIFANILKDPISLY